MMLLICYDDYANYMYNTYKSLLAAGMECECIKIVKHPFSYNNEARVVDNKTALEKVRAAHIILYFHSNLEWWKIIHGLSERKRIIAFHTGTIYRRNPKEMNEIFKDAEIFTDQCEFMHLEYNMNKWKYVATAVDTEKIHPELKVIDLPYKVAHYPSKAETKGSAKILQLINLLPPHNHRMKFLFTDIKVSHADHMKRILECDIYIEMFAPTQHGNPYGCYGVTAFEAAALGKIVMTQNIYLNVYNKAYGCDYPFVMCNTEREFKDNLHKLIMMPKEEIQQLQAETRKCVVEKHSHKATGEHLKNILVID